MSETDAACAVRDHPAAAEQDGIVYCHCGRVIVRCPYCDMRTTTDPYWLTPKDMLRGHWRGVCEKLPWWRKWFGR